MTEVLVAVGRGLREAASMLWATLWAVVLGFGLSGAVQAFVSRAALQRRLGDHRPASLLRATCYGAASSSCSYAAAAMTRSLVAKGADLVSSLAFLVASTNLVIDLGLVLWALLGWPFFVAEVVGGLIMVGLLGVVGPRVLSGRAAEAARKNAGAADQAAGAAPGGEPADLALAGVAAEGPETGWRRARTLAGWADAASFTLADLRMLRRELLVGFLAAGFLAALVPEGFWSALFLHGHGLWTDLENAVVAPAVALASFVCSIGNVPLAAALWRGGASFGGVVAFVLADLVSLPLVLIYRRQYGGRAALRLLGLFWLVMSASGFLVGQLAQLGGLVPASRPAQVVPHAFSLGPTTALDLVALASLAVIVWLASQRTRWGGGAGYALDPVCGMQVETTSAPARAALGGRWVFFCSEHCRDRFVADPDRYAPTLAAAPTVASAAAPASAHPPCHGPQHNAGPLPGADSLAHTDHCQDTGHCSSSSSSSSSDRGTGSPQRYGAG